MKNKDDNNANEKYIKIWGEHIDLKRFILGLLLSIFVLAIILLIIEISNCSSESKLVYGLIGIILSFGFNIKFIRPKRNVQMKDEY